ncbi:MAG: PIN domain-containing protein [Candidatus Baltobacteraceae bacterium]
MSCAIDTNVIIEVIGGTRVAAERAAATLSEQGSRAGLVISPVVYAELYAHPGWGKAQVDQFLQATVIAVDWSLTKEVWELAGRAYAGYAARRKVQRDASQPRRLLADFIIGAHAAQVGGLITSDRGFYIRNFPSLRIISPELPS